VKPVVGRVLTIVALVLIALAFITGGFTGGIIAIAGLLLLAALWGALAGDI